MTITNGLTLKLSLGDVDGDGDLDAAVSQDAGFTKLLLNDGTGTFTLGQDLNDGINSNWSPEFGDFDNDGDLDLLLSKSSAQPNTLWLNDGNGNFTDSGQRLGSSATLGIGIGDLDGDGDLDFISANYNTDNQVWLNENVSLPYTQDFENDTWQGLVINKPQNFSIIDDGGNNKFQTDNSGLTGLSTAVLDSALMLPSTFEMSVEMTAVSGPDRWLDGFLIFDYQSPTDFKYAGMFNGQNQWVIGHYQGNFNDKVINNSLIINNDTPYTAHVRIEGSTVYLAVDGEFVLERTFSGPLNDGQAGIASYNAVTCFDNFEIGVEVDKGAPTDFPYMEDFTDGIADQIGYYGGNRWGISPVSGNNKLFFNGGNNFGLGVAFLENEFRLPNKFEFSATMASYSAAGFWNDGFLVFDYNGPNDFKYAGMFTGQDEWIIGHYQGNWGNRIATASRELYTNIEYTLHLKVDGDHVKLFVDGLPVVEGTFTNGIGEGKVGVAGYNSRTGFDNIVLDTTVDQGSPGLLPYSNNFDTQDAPGIYYYNKLAWGFSGSTNKYLRANTSYLTNPTRQLATAYFPLEQTTAPSDIEITAKVASKNGASSEHNGYVIFDYKHEFDFKYAGFDANTNQWVIGHYQGDWNDVRAMIDWDDTSRTINVNQWYSLNVTLTGTSVSLSVDGEFITSYDFGTALNQGGIGLALYKAFTWFDDFNISELVVPLAPSAFPLFENWDTEADELLI
ncbi:MAG: FG-GAP-like repeat-containing protein [Planctomycetaceae bacterium]